MRKTVLVESLEPEDIVPWATDRDSSFHARSIRDDEVLHTRILNVKPWPNGPASGRKLNWVRKRLALGG